MDPAPVPLLTAKAYEEPSVFRPENLLREGRRQLRRTYEPVPPVCLLDPDGDIVRHLLAHDLAARHPGWACYHTELWTFDLEGRTVGVVGTAVGSSFAVLVAEQLAASGCQLVVSVTSSGLITPVADPPYFVVIDRAWRDEGTSLHYLPPGEWSPGPAHLLARLEGAFEDLAVPVVAGATWTTDAPYRETATAIDHAASLGVLAVEMEAAALYAYAAARDRDVVCLAHVTNTMATEGDDFEKGVANGVHDALAVVATVVAAVVSDVPGPPPPGPLLLG